MTNKEAAQSFDQQRKRCRMLYLIYGIGMLAALAMMFLNEMKSALLIFSLLLIVYFVIVRSTIRQYTVSWREYCVRRFTEKHFSPVTYSYRVTAAELPQLTTHLMMPKSAKGKLMARNLAQGSGDGMEAIFLDATVPTGEGTGTRFHSGCWMGIAFRSCLREPVRIVRGELMADGTYERWLKDEQGFRSCPVPGENFPKDTAFYSLSGEAEVPERAIYALRDLLTGIKGSGVAELSPEGVYVFLPHRLINKLPPSLKFPITEEMIAKLSFPEIDEACRLARLLRAENLPEGEETEP